MRENRSIFRFGASVKLFLLVLVLFSFLSAQAYAVVAGQQVWSKRFSSLGAKDDILSGVAVDSNRNVYVTGVSASDYVTVKFDASGKQKWVRRYGRSDYFDSPASIAVGGAGNVVVTGTSTDGGWWTSDYVTAKYDAAGNQKWIRRYDSPGDNYDVAHDLVLDKKGNVYVTGWVSSYDVDDILTIKYDAAGNKKWARRHNSRENGMEVPAAMVVDSKGNVYVTGFTWDFESDANADIVTIKYDPAGNRRWIRRHASRSNGWDEAMDIAVDRKNNIYVTGHTQNGASEPSADMITIKYDIAGNKKWVRRHNSSGNGWDGAKAVATDSNNNVYITGFIASDYATIKYSPSGQRRWVRRYNTSGNKWEAAKAISVDNNNNILVTGTTGLDEYSWTGNNYLTVKYGPTGNTKWIKEYNGPGKNEDGAVGVAVDTLGSAYVAGYSTGVGSGIDYRVIKYSP